jgi:hypothetical protein
MKNPIVRIVPPESGYKKKIYKVTEPDTGWFEDHKIAIKNSFAQSRLERYSKAMLPDYFPCQMDPNI